MGAYRVTALALLPLALAIGQFPQIIHDAVPTILLHLALVSAVHISMGLQRLRRTSSHFLYDVLLCIPCFYALVVLMGAPFTSQTRATLTLSVSLAILSACSRTSTKTSIWTLIEALGHRKMERGSKVDQKQRAVKIYALALTLGAYLGAIPIPLDWDRDWQQWPITVYTGACLGHAVGCLASLVFVRRSCADSNKDDK
ncbi:GPI biosynthesis protein family Pig-F-domain-containing protein [Protomyces lactucae-debilis]|uniref:GPI biosynthesis protein family Pig-F-domain-containing protein n=1 Tax=Protomyces lactucae-debilis TaxID=2754530 RepID=A0A1Y2FW47_PROLT|nr:GPI biosynthesis protein family Pig-F-domain-containing protein [Protomyces lactucae-debilis]ORY87767.1 GPI biosynthesis protein family Pig-F-domain-containing protein [Protomyces lactucae-debilis]